METNFQMLLKFEYHPEAKGMCTGEEVKMIEDHFQIKERSDVELQNLRDFVVMFYSMKMEDKRKDDLENYFDTMSAVTGVIDFNKSMRGLEV